MAFEIGRAVVSILPDLSNFGPALAARIQATGAAATAASGGMKAGTAFGAAFAGAAVGAGYLAKLGGDFHSAFKTIRVETGATGEALEGLKDSMKNVLSGSAANMNDASAAVATLNTRLGLTGEPLEALSVQMLRLSSVSGTDLAGNLNAASDALYNWSIPAEQYGDTNDMLFRVTQQTGISFTDLASSLATGGVQFRQAGLNIQESAGFVGLLNKAGLGASDALPALSFAMRTAAKEGKDVSTVFAETFDKIRNAPDDIAASQAALDTFGGKAGPKFAALIREGKLSWEDFSKSIGEGDTIEKAAIETRGWQGAIENFKNILKSSLEPAATTVFQNLGNMIRSVKPVIVGVGAVIGWLANILVSIPGPVWGIVAAFGAGVVSIATFSKIFGLVSGAVMTVVNVFKTAFIVLKGIGTAFSAVGSLLAANPVILVILAIVAAVVLLWYHWDTVSRWFVAAWHWIQDVVSAVWSFISGVLSAVGGMLYDWLIAPIIWIWNLWLSWWQMIGGVVRFIWDTIVAVVVGAWNLIYGTVSSIVGWISSTIETAWNRILLVVQTVGAIISTVVGAVFGWISDRANDVRAAVDWIGRTFRRTAQTIGDWLNRGIEFVTSFVDRAIAGLERLANYLVELVDRYFGPVLDVLDTVSGFFGGIFGGIGDALGFADGGRVRPGMGPVWVGERGPELVTFSRPATVLSNGDSMDLLSSASSGGSGGTIVQGALVEISGNVTIRSDQDIVDLSRRLAKDVNSRARANGTAVSLSGSL